MLSCLKCLLPKPGRFIKSVTKSRSPIANPNPTPVVPINQAEVTRQSAQPDTFSRTSAQSAQPDLPNLPEETVASHAQDVHVDEDMKEAIKQSELCKKQEDILKKANQLKEDQELAQAIKQSELCKKQKDTLKKAAQVKEDEELAKAIRHSESSDAKAEIPHHSAQISTSQISNRNASLAAAQALKSSELFGTDLKSIHFKQGQNTNTCYLLSALDNIFQHPQGKKILDLIKIKEVDNGFSVKFPGQPHPISVSYDELGAYVKSETPGVSILEQAYLKIPEAADPSGHDTTNNTLIRIFGAKRVSQPSYEEATMAASAQMQPLVDEFADIWTATRRLIETGRPPRIGEHYYSLRLNPNNDVVKAANPQDTKHLTETLKNQAQLEEGFWPELNRIRLSD